MLLDFSWLAEIKYLVEFFQTSLQQNALNECKASDLCFIFKLKPEESLDGPWILVVMYSPIKVFLKAINLLASSEKNQEVWMFQTFYKLT